VAETDHRLYLVEYDLRGLSSWQLASVQRALGEAVRRENRRGRRIRYAQCIYAPEEQRCLCLFEAADPGLVRSVNDIAQFPLARVTAVLSSVLDKTSPAAGFGDPAAGLGDYGPESMTDRAARLRPWGDDSADDT
jgi:hypothetical protein